MEDGPDFGSRDETPTVPRVPVHSEPLGSPPYVEPPMPVAASEPAAPPAYTPPAYAAASMTPAPRRRSGFGTMLATALIGGLVGAAALGVALFGLGYLTQPGATSTRPVSGISTTTRLVPPAQPIEAVAAKVVPSVVNIAVETGAGGGVGSGVIIRADGYILTNNHVVEGATSIVVRLGTTDLPARVIGTDPTSDLAVIKVDKTGLPAATLGRSSGLQVGEGVIAVGSPFGLDRTVTSGIVSALHRTNLAQGQSGVAAYTNLIQTDASINPGNSGGALADLSGAVVGINTLILSPAGQLGSSQSAGIGFAIPIDFAKTIADQLIAGKPITHPFLGVSTATVTQSIAQIYSLPSDSGALVQQVTPGSPAATAGLQVGDIIVRVDDSVITTSEDVFAAVRNAAIGQKVALEVVRDTRTLTLTATLASDASAQ